MNTSCSSGGASAAQLSYDQTAALTFHHIDYLIHASVRYTQPSNGNDESQSPDSSSPYSNSPPMPILIVEAEQRANGARWTGEFSAKYIEEMSLKTGNFKKFSLFIKMLSSALSKASETVFIDLLTFQDLEALKARKQAAAGGVPPTQTAQSQQKNAMAAAQNKRYIILTYVAEFDKVHYPLPLKFESDPSPAQLKQTIARLRSELELLRSTNSGGMLPGGNVNASGSSTNSTIEKYKAELYRLAEENHRLKSLLAARGGEEKSADGTSSGSNNLTISPLELEQLHNELRTLHAQLEQKQSEHTDLLRQMNGLMSGMPIESLGLQVSLDNMSKQIWNLQQELRIEQQLHAKAKSKAEREQEIMMGELERRLEAERMLRSKCRRLQEEVDDLTGALKSRGASAGHLRNSGSTDSLASNASNRGGSGSIKGPAGRRPLSATSPVMQRTQNRPNSRPPSRPISAASSRSNSPTMNTRGRSSSPGPSNLAGRSRSPSPAGGRFDPTSYVKHKKAQAEANAKRNSAQQREMRTGRMTSPNARSPAGSGSAARSREYSPSGSRSASRNASSANLLSQTSPATSSRGQGHMPPRVPTAQSKRPISASNKSYKDDGKPLSPSKGRKNLDSEDESEAEAARPSSGRRPAANRVDDSFSSEDDRPRSARGNKDHDSIDQRFSALQNFLKAQKVDS